MWSALHSLPVKRSDYFVLVLTATDSRQRPMTRRQAGGKSFLVLLQGTPRANPTEKVVTSQSAYYRLGSCGGSEGTGTVHPAGRSSEKSIADLTIGHEAGSPDVRKVGCLQPNEEPLTETVQENRANNHKTRICMYVCMSMYVCMYVCLYVCTYTHVQYVSRCVYMHIYIYMSE